MWVNLFCNGKLSRNWFIEHGTYEPPFIDVLYLERKQLWEEIKMNCLVEAGSIIYECEHHEMFFNIKASVQPKDIPDDEYLLFIHTLKESPAELLKRKLSK